MAGSRDRNDRARFALLSVLGVLVTCLNASAWLMAAPGSGVWSGPAPAVDRALSRDVPELAVASDLGSGAARLDDPHAGRGERAGVRRASPSHHAHPALNRWWCRHFLDRSGGASASPVLGGTGAAEADSERPLAAEPRRDEQPASRTLEVHGPRGPPATQSPLSHAAV